MNVQNKLVALHHLDVPWRPSDLIQRNGRILRQGNDNEEISIFNYITENTFDAYLWQILEQKQRYISQIMTGRSTLRTCEDVDSTMLQYAEFKALATSDPRIKEKMETDNEISRLTVLKSAWTATKEGKEIPLADCMEGKLDNSGGTVRFPGKGDYSLTATATDKAGRAFSGKADIKIYPVTAFSFDLPSTTHTDKPVEVKVVSSELQDMVICRRTMQWFPAWYRERKPEKSPLRCWA